MKCWNGCNAPVVTTVDGVPVCSDCADHYLAERNRQRFDYTDAATANDMRFGSDSDGYE